MRALACRKGTSVVRAWVVIETGDLAVCLNVTSTKRDNPGYHALDLMAQVHGGPGFHARGIQTMKHPNGKRRVGWQTALGSDSGCARIKLLWYRNAAIDGAQIVVCVAWRRCRRAAVEKQSCVGRSVRRVAHLRSVAVAAILTGDIVEADVAVG